MIEIVTTWVPSFGNDMQDPMYGYQSLSILSSINMQMEITSHATIQLNCEVLALQPSELTETFKCTWAPLGLRQTRDPLHCHFHSSIAH